MASPKHRFALLQGDTCFGLGVGEAWFLSLRFRFLESLFGLNHVRFRFVGGPVRFGVWRFQFATVRFAVPGFILLRGAVEINSISLNILFAQSIFVSSFSAPSLGAVGCSVGVGFENQIIVLMALIICC